MDFEEFRKRFIRIKYNRLVKAQSLVDDVINKGSLDVESKCNLMVVSSIIEDNLSDLKDDLGE